MSELTRPPQPANSNNQIMFDKFAALKREAYASLNSALSIDTMNKTKNRQQTDAAILAYEKSLDQIMSSLKFYEANLANLAYFDEARKISGQLAEMRAQTEERLNLLKTERINYIANQNKTSTTLYPNLAKSKSAHDVNQSEFLHMGDDILNDCVIIDDFDSDNNNDGLPISASRDRLSQRIKDFTKANELIRIDNGVQLFYIADDGTVSTPSYPTTLSLYTFDDQASNSEIVGFIRVGSWLYPLIPNESPAMKTNFNAYIFPNKEQEETSGANKMNCFVGITMASEVSEDERTMFEDVLSSYSSLIYQNQTAANSNTKSSVLHAPASVPRPAPQVSTNIKMSDLEKKELVVISDDEDQKDKAKQSTSEYIAQNLMTGAQYLTSGVQKTTEYANKYIKTGGDKLKTQLNPNEQEVKVDPKVKKAMQHVRYGTHCTVRVSSYLLDKLGSLATYTAKAVAPHIKQSTTHLLSKTGIAGSKENATGYVDGICHVTGSGLQGFAMVYDSLEQAAKTLSKNITDQTVTVVEHKYGPDLANVTQNGMYSVGNVALSVNNIRNLKVARTIAKATAKETIKHSSSGSSTDSKKYEKNFEIDKKSK